MDSIKDLGEKSPQVGAGPAAKSLSAPQPAAAVKPPVIQPVGGRPAAVSTVRNVDAVVKKWIDEVLENAPPPDKVHFGTYLKSCVPDLVKALNGN